MTPQITYHLICAHSWPEYGIGQSSHLPWLLKEDLRRFKRITTQDDVLPIVVMGRVTYMSLPQSVQPLPGRFNIVITSQEKLLENTHSTQNIIYSTWSGLEDTIQSVLKNHDKVIPTVYFIGGAQIYKLALEQKPISTVHITEVYVSSSAKSDGDGMKFDAFFPKYNPIDWSAGGNNFKLIKVSPFENERNVYYRYLTFKSNTPPGLEWQSEEAIQYLSIMKQIIERGLDRIDRTQVGTLSLFGTTQRYDLRDTFPLSTTKRMFFRAIFEELRLYLSGRTDNAILQAAGIHIWDGNTTRDFLDKRGLTQYPEGDMGETYGFNFRHYGAPYTSCKADHPLDGTVGYDQVANLIHLLKTDPTSRRMLINLWNPATQHKAALPACLMLYQFYVNTQLNTLNCQIYLRSSDYFLANNWNTCTGALLVHMLCQLRDIPYTPGEIIVITGDTHIYKNHMSQVNENLSRHPYPFPKLIIQGGPKDDLMDIQFEDLKLIGYRSHPSISAPMAV